MKRETISTFFREFWNLSAGSGLVAIDRGNREPICSAGFENWSTGRRRAVAEFFETAISGQVQGREYDLLDDWICAAGRAGINVASLLRVVKTDTAAVLGYWERNAGTLDDGKLGNGFWELPNEQHDAIVRWFSRPDINLIYAEAYGYRTYN